MYYDKIILNFIYKILIYHLVIRYSTHNMGGGKILWAVVGLIQKDIL
jgi:hypothetical protein